MWKRGETRLTNEEDGSFVGGQKGLDCIVHGQLKKGFEERAVLETSKPGK